MIYTPSKDQHLLLEDKIWSYSSLKNFTQCPYSFYRKYCLEDKKDSPNTFFGSAFHKYQEEYAKHTNPNGDTLFKEYKISSNNKGMWDYCLENGRSFLETQVFKYDFKTEEEITEEIYGRKFVFIIDLLVFKGDKIFLYDYKTSKTANYANDHRDQMAFYNYIIKKRYPRKEIITQLFFPKVNRNILLEDLKFDLRDIFKKVNTILNNDDFKPKTNKFCNWCAYQKDECPVFNK